MTDIAVDLAVASALVGRSPRWLARRGLDPRAVLMGSKGSSTARNPRAQRWTDAELKHLRAQLPYKSDEALAAELGRSTAAIKIIRQRRLRTPGPSRSTDLLTAEHAAMGLGIDSHAMGKIIDRGILTGAWRREYGGASGKRARYVRLMTRVTLLRWMTRPESWIYFDPRRVNRPPAYMARRSRTKYDGAFWAAARRLVLRRYLAWGDRWITTAEFAKMAGLKNSNCANQVIKRGQIAGVRWNNWRVLESDARAYIAAHGASKFTPGYDRFLVVARAVGHSWDMIGRLMKCHPRQAVNRYRVILRDRRSLTAILRDEPCIYGSDGDLVADLFIFQWRFPRLWKMYDLWSHGVAHRARGERSIMAGIAKRSAQAFALGARKRARRRAKQESTKGAIR